MLKQTNENFPSSISPLYRNPCSMPILRHLCHTHVPVVFVFLMSRIVEKYEFITSFDPHNQTRTKRIEQPVLHHAQEPRKGAQTARHSIAATKHSHTICNGALHLRTAKSRRNIVLTWLARLRVHS